MKYIVQPLNRKKTKEIEPIGTSISQQWGVWFLHGNPKVGKTALVHKIHRWLFKKGYENPLIHIPFGLIKDHEIDKLLSALKSSKWKIQVPHYILLDDVEYLKRRLHKKQVIHLIEAVKKLSNEYRVLLIISSNDKENLKDYAAVLDSPDNKSSAPYLHLERPPYIDGDIKKFGDTILTIEN